jgi:D-arabinose 1-dehydrogenase-like Zn-dependent alcohol dehydrogenase
VCHSDLHTARNEWMMTVYPVVPGHEIVGRVSRVGSGVTGFAAGDLAGIGETQEMLDFCAQHGITSDVEMIAMQDINLAYERMLKSDVKYRFVIDMASLTSPGH